MEMEVFVNVDRELLDLLYDVDRECCSKSLICLKNAVIGSNRQKTAVIAQGIIPKLIDIAVCDDTTVSARLDASIILGSIAKGTDHHVNSLIYYNIVDILLKIVINPNSPLQLVEHSLCTLKTVASTTFAPFEAIYTNPDNISRLIDIAKETKSWKIQSCITYILIPMYTSKEQLILYNAGIVSLLADEILSGQPYLQIPALKCLASICFTNKSIAFAVCNLQYKDFSMIEVLNNLVSRTQPSFIQLSASRCLTYMYRCGALSSMDYKIMYRTMPCLARLCSPEFDEISRSSAANYLAYLTEIETELQRMASICYRLLDSLINLLKSSSPEAKESAFRCIASICSNDEEIRKRVIEKDNVMNEINIALKSSFPEVRLAAAKCLHSLSRSVQLLRTAFQDHIIWRPLMDLVNSEPISLELQKILSSTICNLLLEFSPSKEPLLQCGALEHLCELTFNSDATLRLNGIWGLMNMAFQAEENVKSKIIECLGTHNILSLLNDGDTRIAMKALGLLRNLLSNSGHIQCIMEQHSTQVLKAIYSVFENGQPHNVQEQALCIVGNIVLGCSETDYILDDEKIMKKITEFLDHSDVNVRSCALFVVANILQNQDKYRKLANYDIIEKLQKLDESNSLQLFQSIKQTLCIHNVKLCSDPEQQK